MNARVFALILLICALAVASGLAISIVGTPFSVTHRFGVQLTLGIFCFALGRLCRVRKRWGSLWMLLLTSAVVLLTALIVSGMISPVGDPYSFLLDCLIEIPFAVVAFVLGIASHNLGHRNEVKGLAKEDAVRF